MKEKLQQIASLFDKVLDLIVEDKFEELPSTIKEIKDLLNEVMQETSSEIVKSEDELQGLVARLDSLEERVSVLENLRNTSAQLKEEIKKSNIWNF